LTAHLWASIDRIFRAILVHPFVTGLRDGTLPEAAFRFYVVQDALYLTRYARALSVCAARAPGDRDIDMFNQHASGALAVERSLHEGFFADFGLSAEAIAATPLAPTNLAYTSYLLATAHGGSFAEALGAVLPCYWIYWEVGKALLATGSPHPLYRRWIDTYGGEEFAAVVGDVLALTERIGAGLGPDDRCAMIEHFVTTSRYEWLFWEAAFRMESWPI
jgi:thiaminase/transcriptional activator TenA